MLFRRSNSLRPEACIINKIYVGVNQFEETKVNNRKNCKVKEECRASRVGPDDLSNVLMPSTTWYSKLYQVKPSYLE